MTFFWIFTKKLQVLLSLSRYTDLVPNSFSLYNIFWMTFNFHSVRSSVLKGVCTRYGTRYWSEKIFSTTLEPWQPAFAATYLHFKIKKKKNYHSPGSRPWRGTPGWPGVRYRTQEAQSACSWRPGIEEYNQVNKPRSTSLKVECEPKS